MPIGIGTGATAKGASSSSLTVPITCSGSNRVLLAGAVSSAITPVKPSGATYNGVPMTEVGTLLSVNLRVTWYILVAPASGTNNLVVSYGTTNDENFIAGVGLNEVDQTTPILNSTTATGSDTLITVTESATTADNIVIDISGHIRTDETIGPGQTLIAHDEDVGGFTCINMSYETGAGPHTMSWLFGGAHFWASVGLEIQALTVPADPPSLLGYPSTLPFPPEEPITSEYVASNWRLWFSLITKKLAELVFNIGSVTNKSADYTATIKDSTIYVTSGVAGVDITLPPADSVPNKFYYIYKIDGGAGPLVILPDGTDKINGLASKTITAQWGGVLVRKSSSTSWVATSLVGL